MNTRIIKAPPEFHALRHDQFRRDREKHEARKEKLSTQTVHSCGCVTYLENGIKSVTVHFCPTHWKERKR